MAGARLWVRAVPTPFYTVDSRERRTVGAGFVYIIKMELDRPPVCTSFYSINLSHSLVNENLW